MALGKRKVGNVKTHTVSIFHIVTLLISVVALAFSIASLREASSLKQGISNGFRLDGVYRDEKSEQTSLSFHEEDDNRWQIIASDGNEINGAFEVTENPNYFLLIDQSGNKYGSVYLSYVTPDGSQGILYLNNGDSIVSFKKIARDPVFIETQ